MEKQRPVHGTAPQIPWLLHHPAVHGNTEAQVDYFQHGSSQLGRFSHTQLDIRHLAVADVRVLGLLQAGKHIERMRLVLMSMWISGRAKVAGASHPGEAVNSSRNKSVCRVAPGIFCLLLTVPWAVSGVAPGQHSCKDSNPLHGV